MNITVEFSLYPLRRENLWPDIKRFLDVLENEGIKVETGIMSSFLVGEAKKVFETMAKAVEEVGESCEFVLKATFSNACLRT